MVEVLRNYLERFIMLTDEDVVTIDRITEVRHFDKKAMVTQVGEKEAYLNFVLHGLARKYFVSNGDEIITQIAKEGELINSSVAYLTGHESDYCVDTIEPTIFLSFTAENLNNLFQLGNKWQRLGRLIMTELFLKKEIWELDRVRLSTKERFLKFTSENPDLYQRVPQKFLASYLHIKPETFSRFKQLLKSKVY